MSCESCYNGCVETVSDQCVRYTGPNSVPLQIQTGDPLLSVEEALINAVVSFLDGSGISITVDPSYYCALVTQYLPAGPVHTVPQMFTALVRAACSLQGQVTSINATLATLNADYVVDCLTGVIPSDDTHTILQAVINKLCALEDTVSALSLDVSTNYVKLSDLDALIAAYLAGQSGNVTQQYLKMVPFTVVEYYGPLTNFDATGAGVPGLGWDKVFLCNGSNGTPDKRGRVGVGAIVNVPGGPLNAAVDPSYTGNPNYAIEDIAGANLVAISTNQLPSHTHTAVASASSIVTDPGHSHYAGNSPEGWDSSGSIGIVNRTPQNVQTTVSTTGITVATTVNVSNSNTGSGQGHANIQPVLAAYYIMYIP